MAYKQKHDKSSFPFKSSPNKASYFSFSSSKTTERDPTKSESVVERGKPIKDQEYGKVETPMFQKTDSSNGKKPKDDDSDRMTDAEHKAHVDKVTEYNKKNTKKHHDPKGLMKKIQAAASGVRVRINKLNTKKEEQGGLNDDDAARLKDLKREYSDHQTTLHNMRGK